MRLCFCIIVIGFLFTAGLSLFSQTEQDDQTHAFAEDLIRDILVRIKSSDEGHLLLDSVNPAVMSFNHNLNHANAAGWIERWRLAKGTAVVPNTNQESASSNIEIVTDKSGILLELFIASKEGDMLVSRTNAFTISKNPRMVIGYYLKTWGKNPLLKKRIDQTITDTIKAKVENNKTE
jgi:hypothetical protein